ncbi:hypothetical protein DFH06DRAFT_1305047 [Mycena polygramma]|nr:hypothetical protein DFH06DRAFT_1305047 [Mycena polygramma]
MSTISQRITAAVDLGIQTSTFTLDTPAVSEAAWTAVLDATDDQLAELIRAGKLALASCYLAYMTARNPTSRAYDLISQNLFTQRTYRLLLLHAKSPVDPKSSPILYSNYFHLHVACLQQSLDALEMGRFFASVFGPLVIAGEGMLPIDTVDDVPEPGRPRKIARLQSDSKYRGMLKAFVSRCPQRYLPPGVTKKDLCISKPEIATGAEYYTETSSVTSAFAFVPRSTALTRQSSSTMRSVQGPSSAQRNSASSTSVFAPRLLYGPPSSRS